MVYRGKPSAGCENCRKAKKRCGLEQPACSRCVKLSKPCSGYRDTSQLQIRDESESVRLKATRTKATPTLSRPHSHLAPPRDVDFSIATTETVRSNSSGSSGSNSIELPTHYTGRGAFFQSEPQDDAIADIAPVESANRMYLDIKPKADDVAKSYFFIHFTSEHHWSFVREFVMHSKLDACLDYAIRACGMAALSNVSSIAKGNTYSRSMYVSALSLLNAALRDPQRSKLDESLIAVVMLGYYENLACDSRESIQSWKAHTRGATQLLALRGKAQLKTNIGRLMYRETRAQIVINAIWEDEEPPAFIVDWESDLDAAAPTDSWTASIDDIAKIGYDIARLRSRMKYKTIPNTVAAEYASQLDTRMILWATNAQRPGGTWRYHDIKVPDSPHIWNNAVSCYTLPLAPSVWQTYRCLRIMNTHTQELLCKDLNFCAEEREEQGRYFRRVRRQMTDEICATVPVALGHAPAPTFNSPTRLLSAYATVWPLFLAGIYALECIGTAARERTHARNAAGGITQTSAASAQAAWILGRMDYISKVVGLRWASGIAAMLKGDFRLRNDCYLSPRIIMEKETPLTACQDASDTIWTGRLTGENDQIGP